jgi:hypothetical protein
MLKRLILQNLYVIKMGVASLLVLLKVYVASLVLGEAPFSDLISLYYIGNVLIVILPFGSLLFMHSVLPAQVARADTASRQDIVGGFVTAALVGTTLLGVVVFAVWWTIGGFASHSAAAVFAWAYAISQIAIIRTKVFRAYDRFADLLILRATLTFAAVMTALLLKWQILSLIFFESIVLTAFSTYVLFGMPIRFAGFLAWMRRTVHFTVPSVIGAIFGNLDRLIATATLADDNLARFGVLYLMVGVFGTLTQFVNTKFLPELFIAGRAEEPGSGTVSKAVRAIGQRPLYSVCIGLVVLIAVYLVCWAFSALTPYRYSRWELLLVAVASVARVSELIGSVGMVSFGVEGVCIIQAFIGTTLIGLYWLIQPASVASALTVTVAMYCSFALLTMLIRHWTSHRRVHNELL